MKIISKQILFLFAAFILSVAMGLTYFFVKSINQLENKILLDTIQFNGSIDELAEHRNSQWVFEGLYLNDISVSNYQGKEVGLHTVLLRSNVILFIHQNMCYDCIEEIVEEIKKSENDEELTILGCYESMATFKQLTDDFKVSSRIYNTHFKSFNKRFDNLLNPIMFYVGDDYHTERIFFPIKGWAYMINDYFRITYRDL